MQPADFKHWRKLLNLSQKEAAEALGLKRRVVQYYEKGERDGEKVTIPKAVRLACWALMNGITDYHGPEGEGGDESSLGKKERKALKEAREVVKEAAKEPAKEDKKRKPRTPDLGGAADDGEDESEDGIEEGNDETAPVEAGDTGTDTDPTAGDGKPVAPPASDR